MIKLSNNYILPRNDCLFLVIIFIITVAPDYTLAFNISTELSNCIHGGCDPGNYLNKSLKISSRKSAEGFSEGVRKELEKSMDYLFDNKVDPLTDKINYMVSQQITHSKEQAEDLMLKGFAEISALKDETKRDIERLIANVDTRYQASLKKTFDEIILYTVSS